MASFTVKIDSILLQQGESVAVTGSHERLGFWSPAKAVILNHISADSTVDSKMIWSARIDLPVGTEVEYRYFTCIVVDSGKGQRKVLVRKLESNVLPRKLVIKDVTHEENRIETFGSYNGEARIDRGWITYETLLHFKFSHSAIQIHKKSVPTGNLLVKLTPVELNSIPLICDVDESPELDGIRRNPSDETWPAVEVAVMNDTDYIFKKQNQFGTEYNPDEMMIFQCQVLYLETVGFLVDIFSSSQDSVLPHHLGYSYIMPHLLMDSSEGMLNLTVVNRQHHPVGHMKVDYIVIRPLPEGVCDMSVSLAKYWSSAWAGLEIGHRGCGSSFKPSIKSCSDIRENTLASLQAAASHGADYLEFDVQLSKDLVPVVYHDFFVNVLLKKKSDNVNHDKLLLPVKDFTFSQLQELKFLNKAEGDVSKLPDIGDDRPFPTLMSVLESVDEHVGMNVELKWNMQRTDGSYELDHPFDLGMYVDKVVTTVLRFGGKRKIIFSCFHPDVCVMLRLKQHKHPVLFLTQGITSKWMPYKDPRTSTIARAAHFAVNADLLGINVHAEDILRDPAQVDFVKKLGLTIFCWGEDNNDKEIILRMKKLGLDGIIYDKFNEYRVKPNSESVFLVEARQNGLATTSS